MKLFFNKIFFPLFLAFALVSTAGVYAQNTSRARKKAVKYFDTALEHYKLLDYENASMHIDLAIGEDSNYVDVWLLKAEMHSDMNNYNEAIYAYGKALEIDPHYYDNAWYSMGHLEMLSGYYEDGKQHLDYFLSLDGVSPKIRLKAEKSVSNCEFAIYAMDNPLEFFPEKMGGGINTEFNEYWPSVTADNGTLVFTRLDETKTHGINAVHKDENFYISNYSGEEWESAIKMSSTINTYGNEGAQSLTADGKFMYFTACNREDGLGSCDIYVSSRLHGKWLYPKNLGAPINSGSWEVQPSISPDGRTLYFASNRKGGEGKMDIWYSVLQEDGRWSEPLNLGDSINTPGNEQSPYIHKDNKTLYFSSDGHTGMGGFDLFMSEYNVDSHWAEPYNLGYPINTWSDEMGLVLSADGQTGYYSSSVDYYSGRDIYSFNVPDLIKPDPVSWIEGDVFDRLSEKPLLAKVELTDLDDESNVFRAYSDKNGKFLVSLPPGKDYALNASKDGYLIYSAHFKLKGVHYSHEPRQLKVPLSPLVAGQRTDLHNVFFEFNSAGLLDESMIELGRLIKVLEDNPNITILVEGHTDSKGNDNYNMGLSERRAASVVDYLISMGISVDRLSATGYGETKPAATNSTEGGRAFNRRIEVLILEVD